MHKHVADGSLSTTPTFRFYFHNEAMPHTAEPFVNISFRYHFVNRENKSTLCSWIAKETRTSVDTVTKLFTPAHCRTWHIEASTTLFYYIVFHPQYCAMQGVGFSGCFFLKKITGFFNPSKKSVVQFNVRKWRIYYSDFSGSGVII